MDKKAVKIAASSHGSLHWETLSYTYIGTWWTFSPALRTEPVEDTYQSRLQGI